MLCDYGCGEEALYEMTSGKFCCSDFYTKCPTNREKNSKGSKGRIFTDEHRKKLSDVKKGKTGYWKSKKNPDQSERMNGKNNPMYGKILTGENNPNWKGGIAHDSYCPVWLDKEYKETIKERDGYQCLNPDCGKNSDRLFLHHIDYNKKNCHPFNLITVCASCNSKANFNRDWHTAWYQAIILNRYRRN